MKPEQENFDQLRGLLKLKRYEQPPPRYFNDFSGRVIARVRAGELGGREAAQVGESWVARIWSLIEARPMLPGAVGVAVCAMLVFVAVSTDSVPSMPGPEIIQTQSDAPAPDSISPLSLSQFQPHPAAFAGTNSGVRLRGSLFDQVPIPPAELISRPFGNN